MVRLKNIQCQVFVLFFVFVLIPGCKTGTGPKQTDEVQASVANAEPLPGMSIHEAALNGEATQVFSLLDGGMSVDTLDIEGRSPLMYASFNGYTAIVKKLLEKGANVNLQDKYGRTALMMASSGPYQETVKLLLEKYADPNIVDTEEHFTALMYASSEGQMENVKLLLANKADPSFKDIDGDDAMSFAKNNGHSEVFVLLQSLSK
jgi:ankyrin repeat protein